MKRFFSLSVTAVVTSSLIMGGCSDGSENLPTAEIDVLEEDAEWVRVDLKLSSEHPYTDNQDENWELQAPQEAQGIRVHFNEFETEEGRDFFVLGEHIYHGSLGSFTTDVAPGNLVPVQFSTDESVNHYGYDIDYYEYLMPHTALRGIGLKAGSDAVQKSDPELKLRLTNPSEAYHLTKPVEQPALFQDEHYKALIERDLIYRCWKSIPPLHVMPEPYTLTLQPTALFSLKMLYDKPIDTLRGFKKTASIFNGKPMLNGFSMKHVNVSSALAPKVMRAGSLKTRQSSVKVNTRTVKVGFGAWKLKKFNQKKHHAKTSPQMNSSQGPSFKMLLNPSTQPHSGKTLPTFRLKNFKI